VAGLDGLLVCRLFIGVALLFCTVSFHSETDPHSPAGDRPLRGEATDLLAQSPALFI
jgi:hypothetical protein